MYQFMEMLRIKINNANQKAVVFMYDSVLKLHPLTIKYILCICCILRVFHVAFGSAYSPTIYICSVIMIIVSTTQVSFANVA